ncbi:MAG: hypothetical protein QXO51_07465 [Halobacteria archaeon]
MMKQRGARDDFIGDWDGAEEVMGVLMLLGIFAISLAVIYAGGVPSLQASQSGASLQQVEQAFTALDSKLSKAALGESPSQSVEVNLAGGALTLRNTSWMNITFKDSAGTLIGCINVSLGTLEYTKENRTIAYESGGLFARYPDGGQAFLSPPELHYDGETLTLPIIQLNGTGSQSGAGTTTVRIDTSNQPVVYFPNGSATGCGTNALNRVNPLEEVTVNVTVRSDYWQAWAAAMRRQTSITASTDNTNQLAIAQFGTETATTPFQQGVFAATALKLYNSAEVWSYNSATQTCGSGAQEGDVAAANSIELQSSAKVYGNASTEGTITLRSSARVVDGPNPITSGICKAASVVNEGAGCDGGIQAAASISSMPSVDGTVASKISSYSDPAVNENAENGAGCGISDSDFVLNLGNSASCTLTAGQYYVTKVDLGNSATLILDTSAGGIDIAVDNTGATSKFDLGNSAIIEVRGSNNNPVNYYLDSGLKPTLANSAKLTMQNDGGGGDANLRNTSRHRVWLHSGSGTWTIDNSAYFVGVMYGPKNNVVVQNSGKVCGALIGYAVDLKNSQRVDFDVNLKNVQFFSSVPLVIQYLHLSGNRLNVTLG